jgi:proline iminopeptidase
MQTLYPAIKTYATHRLAVDDTHQIYIEECGNPAGIPVLVIHAGPGAGCETMHRQLFDPNEYRVICYDQRGAGRSTPHACLEKNTTPDLLSDIEAIRAHLNIKRWVLWGSSWGATLALLYAQQHPQCVRAMILHSIFLARQQDIEWFYLDGANKIFPDYWQDFIKLLSPTAHNDPIAAYHKRLTGSDEIAKLTAAKAWSLWQARCTALQPHNQIINHFADPHFAVCLSTIETHYMQSRCFIAENQVLDNIACIQHIPAFIIHGRYNIVCPLQSALILHDNMPTSELYIVRDAGHAVTEPGTVDAIILTTRKIARCKSHLA